MRSERELQSRGRWQPCTDGWRAVAVVCMKGVYEGGRGGEGGRRGRREVGEWICDSYGSLDEDRVNDVSAARRPSHATTSTSTAATPPRHGDPSRTRGTAPRLPCGCRWAAILAGGSGRAGLGFYFCPTFFVQLFLFKVKVKGQDIRALFDCRFSAPVRVDRCRSSEERQRA